MLFSPMLTKIGNGFAHIKEWFYQLRSELKSGSQLRAQLRSGSEVVQPIDLIFMVELH